VPCRINVFSGRKRERSPRENPQNGDFEGVLHGDLAFASQVKDTKNSSRERIEYRVLSCGGAKIRQNNHLAGFRVATFRPAMQRYDKQGRKRERSPRENRQMVTFVFSHGDLSPRQAKIRQTRGEGRRMKSVVLSCGGAKGRHAKTRTNHHLAGFCVAPFRPENTIIRHGKNQPPYKSVFPPYSNNIIT